MSYEYTSGLGVGKSYGPYEDSPFGTSPSTFGLRNQVVVPVFSDNYAKAQSNVSDRYLTQKAADRDPEGDANVFVVPEGSLITAVDFYTVNDVATGGSGISVDLKGDSTVTLASSAATDTTAGDWTVDPSSAVGKTVGSDSEFDATQPDDGEGGYLVVEYLKSPVA